MCEISACLPAGFVVMTVSMLSGRRKIVDCCTQCVQCQRFSGGAIDQSKKGSYVRALAAIDGRVCIDGSVVI